MKSKRPFNIIFSCRRKRVEGILAQSPTTRRYYSVNEQGDVEGQQASLRHLVKIVCCHATRQPMVCAVWQISFGTPVVPEVWVMY